jgi:uncharacterized phage infection (PIP) family protein YhgE
MAKKVHFIFLVIVNYSPVENKTAVQWHGKYNLTIVFFNFNDENDTFEKVQVVKAEESRGNESSLFASLVQWRNKSVHINYSSSIFNIIYTIIFIAISWEP